MTSKRKSKFKLDLFRFKKRTHHFSAMSYDSTVQQGRVEFLTKPNMGAYPILMEGKP